MKATEASMQALVMRWAMIEKHHALVVPGATSFFHYGWEADVISVTPAGLAHEFEIKISKADYCRDAKKYKHHFIGDQANAPAYFWYVTCGFEIDPPEKAGWIYIREANEIDDPLYRVNTGLDWVLRVRKEAPRLNKWHIETKKQIEIARLLSWRVTNLFTRQYLDQKEG
jgi:hypothetical protein